LADVTRRRNTTSEELMTIRTSYQPGEPVWVDLCTPDLDATVAFYGGLFGWTVDLSRSADFGGYANFGKDGRKVAGVMPQMSPEMPTVWSCYVATDDADKTATRVGELGGMVVAPPMDVAELGTMAVFTAPDGSFFGTWKAGTHLGFEVTHEEGCPAWIELSTRDQGAALPFYQELFGWGADVNPGYTEFQQGGQSIAGCMDMPDMVPDVVPSYWMPYFTAGDPAAKAQEAAALGATVLVPYMEADKVAFSVVSDPHGSAFGLLRVDD
jgi:predicted enzyme related to lactoylglutathione lyase